MNYNSALIASGLIGCLCVLSFVIHMNNALEAPRTFCAERQMTLAITTDLACIDINGKSRIIKDF